MDEILINLEKVIDYIEILKKREYVNRYSKPLEIDNIFITLNEEISKITIKVQEEIIKNATLDG